MEHSLRALSNLCHATFVGNVSHGQIRQLIGQTLDGCDLLLSVLLLVDFGSVGSDNPIARSPAEAMSDQAVRRVTAQCLVALGNLCLDDEVNTDRLGCSGGCSLVMDAVRTFSNDVQIVEYGLATLGNLSHNVENLKKLVEIGICELVLTAIDQHLTSAKVS